MNKPTQTLFDFDASPNRRGGDSHKWNRYGSDSRDVIAAWVADMDFLTPAPVIRAVQQRLQGPALGYSDLPLELTEVFLARMHKAYGWRIDRDWLVPLTGVVPGLFGAVRAVGEGGDRVITQSPNYHHFFGAAEFSDRTLLKLDNSITNGRWEMDFDQLNALADAGAGSFLLCNPHNPVGRVLTGDELSNVADACLRNDVVICSDEIHADIILDRDMEHIPIATLSPEVERRSITLVSPSKAFNLPGVGGFAMAIIPGGQLRRAFEASLHGFVAHPSALANVAALAAYRECDEWLVQLLDYLRDNRDLLQGEVASIDGLSMTPVEATFLAWIDVSALQLNNPFEHFLEHGVALSDGKPMGDPDYLRLNFGCTRATLEQIVARLKQAVAAARRGL